MKNLVLIFRRRSAYDCAAAWLSTSLRVARWIVATLVIIAFGPLVVAGACVGLLGLGLAAVAFLAARYAHATALRVW